MNIIFFDDDCLICNKFVRLIINLDKNNNLFFSSLSSDTAESINIIKINPQIDSVIYKKNNSEFIYSDAVLEILKDLGINLWILRVIPKNIRDIYYKIIAMFRKKFNFSFSDKKCELPPHNIRKKFLI